MRLALALVVLASAVNAQPVRPGLSAEAGAVAVPDTAALADRWLGPDKALHLTASFALTAGGNAALAQTDALRDGRALPVAAGGALVLGLAKELGDARRPVRPLFSWRDLAADALGVALAVVLVVSSRDGEGAP